MKTRIVICALAAGLLAFAAGCASKGTALSTLSTYAILDHKGAATGTNRIPEWLTVYLEAGMDTAVEAVTVYTDSQYVQKGISGWIQTWKRNGWRTKDRKPVKNQELWLLLDELASRFKISWQWVQGHAGNEFNERCDSMTQTAIASLQ